MSGMAICGGRPDFRSSENEAIPFTAPERGKCRTKSALPPNVTPAQLGIA